MDNTNNQGGTGGKAAIIRNIITGRKALEDACKAINIPKGVLCDESMIATARFRALNDSVFRALQAVIEAEVNARSFVATFGTALLAIDEDADGEAAE